MSPLHSLKFYMPQHKNDRKINRMTERRTCIQFEIVQMNSFTTCHWLPLSGVYIHNGCCHCLFANFRECERHYVMFGILTGMCANNGTNHSNAFAEICRGLPEWKNGECQNYRSNFNGIEYIRKSVALFLVKWNTKWFVKHFMGVWTLWSR